MAANFTKQRKEQENYSIDFNARLDTDENINSINIVNVDRWIYNSWYDRTTEFMLASGTVSSGVVQITLIDATDDGQQIPSIYRIFCKVTTDQDRELVEQPILNVFDY